MSERKKNGRIGEKGMKERRDGRKDGSRRNK